MPEPDAAGAAGRQHIISRRPEVAAATAFSSRAVAAERDGRRTCADLPEGEGSWCVLPIPSVGVYARDLFRMRRMPSHEPYEP